MAHNKHYVKKHAIIFLHAVIMQESNVPKTKHIIIKHSCPVDNLAADSNS